MRNEGLLAPPSKRSILLVDDDLRQLKLNRIRLEEAGFDVETAENGEHALERLSQHAHDAVVSDVLMGEVDGFGLCRMIRQQARFDQMPVILLSAHYEGDAERDLAVKVGAQALVTRSPDFDAELEALEQGLRNSRCGGECPVAERTTYEQHLRLNGHQLSKLLSQATRAEERYRKLLEHAHDAIMITRSDGTIVEANGRWRELLGVPGSELAGQQIQAHGVDHEQWRMALASGRETIGPISFVHRDGRIVQMMLSLTMVDVDGESLVLSIGNDVTKVLEMGQAVAGVEERYRALLERIPDVIWTKSSTDALTFFTPNAEKLFGESLSVLRVEGASARLGRAHPDDAGAVRKAFDDYVDEGTPFDLEYRFRRKDGRWCWLRERSFPRAQRDGSTTYEGMISDITERKRLEEDLRQSQKMEALGQLTGGIAHDFNNILATILATSQFLIDALPEGDQRREDAQTISDAGDRAAALTRQLLAFSRRQLLEPQILDLDVAVTGVQRMLRSIIRENITFEFASGPSRGSVRIDLGQLEQVIMNLVVNACDAMPAGGRLTVETGDDDARNMVLLRIRDTGHGIDPATLARIFEPFFTTKEKGRGTGLGLATCYGIVEQSGGHIAVESELGVGTTFTISLPCVGERPSTSRRSLMPPVLDGSETILLIEDDEGVRTVACRLLERRGYRVLTAADAPRALRVAHEETAAIDLVVSDIILPGASGPSVVDRIRKERPNIRALYVSGYHDPLIETNEPLHILEKPFRPEKLLRAVRAELAR